jgi:phage gpG-like protein
MPYMSDRIQAKIPKELSRQKELVRHQQKLIRVLAEELSRNMSEIYNPDDVVAWAEAKVKEQEGKP